MWFFKVHVKLSTQIANTAFCEEVTFESTFHHLIDEPEPHLCYNQVYYILHSFQVVDYLGKFSLARFELLFVLISLLFKDHRGETTPLSCLSSVHKSGCLYFLNWIEWILKAITYCQMPIESRRTELSKYSMVTNVFGYKTHLEYKWKLGRVFIYILQGREVSSDYKWLLEIRQSLTIQSCDHIGCAGASNSIYVGTDSSWPPSVLNRATSL